ncbi:sulfonate transport system substrate-binding protein [Hamadaea flava]|uniref:ABC transporter substrate-binding protein n=1 Tax=Hamadaea flava TaxID=1742688 RepID=A0ABV8LPG4_9ACTN|nr:ABC transporter substrate-binding protein [Hamadaea flava]MCP2323063.1 sulfonate transport system substrate-binding protein [Hamadaea flava]
MALRIGYFPHNNSLWVLRHRGIVERTIPDVEWIDIRTLPPGPRPDVTAGLPTSHGDGLFDGSYDFIGTGFTPPITAQAHGHDIVYVGVSGPRVENSKFVVREDSPITSLEDLRGKRIGIGHGSWQTTLALFALDKVGLTWSDVTPVDLNGNDGAQLFLDGEIDAWTGSYPSLTRVEQQIGVRELIPTDGLFSHRSLWFTRRDFAVDRAEELAVIVAALQESDTWIRDNPREAAELFAADGGGDLDEWEYALRHRPFGVLPVSEDFVLEQQRAADLLYANGLLPKRITVTDALLPGIAEAIPPVPETAAA